MDNGIKLFDRLTMSADLPGECMPRIPIVEIAGEQRVLIENHCGVAGYGTNEIRIRVSFGLVCVLGNNLQIARVTKEQMVIFGRIESVSILRGCK